MTEYGISTWIAKNIACEEAIRLFASSGFREIELSACLAAIVAEWEADPGRIAARLRDNGLRVRQIHSPDHARQLDHPDPQIRRESIEANCAYFEPALRTGAEWIAIHPTGAEGEEGEGGREGRKARAIESLQILAGRAAEAGIGLAVENLPTRDNRRPGATMSELLDMIDGLPGKVGLCFDIGHTIQTGLDPIAEIETAGARLVSLHLHDVDSNGKDHYVPGEGVIDWNAVLGTLGRIGFGGVRTLEILPPKGDVRERIEAVAAVRRQWESQ
ncbi:MAG: fructoselysine 3-epimerase [candidate division BRC1 bacterium ADurb.BinA364]|nr:MAG: fructoselysine 3-epimerase [candidate division BRC1 bacterium ADurb.BinA364]